MVYVKVERGDVAWKVVITTQGDERFSGVVAPHPGGASNTRLAEQAGWALGVPPESLVPTLTEELR